MELPKILEVTLRDGSYSIDFKFTAKDTEVIGGALDSLGFEFVEIGHGVGLGASEKGYGKAAETDEKYLQVAAATFKNAKWGMFCMCGVRPIRFI